MDRERAMELYNNGSKSYRRIYQLWHGASDEEMSGMHIHHKDHDHCNHHPLNLELLTPDEHAQKHGFISNFIMSQSSAVERASHPEVRKRAAAKIRGENNGSYGIPLRERFSTEEEYEAFCDKYRRGKNNPQYGNVGRISGDKNPMKHLTEEEKDAWKEKLSKPVTGVALDNLRKAAKCPERRAKISESKKGNTANQIYMERVRGMSDQEFKEELKGKKPVRITYLNNVRNKTITTKG